MVNFNFNQFLSGLVGLAEKLTVDCGKILSQPLLTGLNIWGALIKQVVSGWQDDFFQKWCLSPKI